MVKGLIYIVSCPHHRSEAGAEDDESGEQSGFEIPGSEKGAAGSNGGAHDQSFEAFQQKLSKMQRVQKHYFRARLLVYPTKPPSAAPDGGLKSPGAVSLAEAYATAAATSNVRVPPLPRRPVLVQGKPVDELVPILGSSNEVWQLIPRPPPGRYLLAITPNEALSVDSHSRSCFHAVVAA